MAEYVEGKRPVLEALRAKVPVKCLYVAEGLKGDKVVDDVVRRCHKMGVSVKQVRRSDLDARSERGSHQGLMLETRPYSYVSGQDIIDEANRYAQDHNGHALIIILDHIT